MPPSRTVSLDLFDLEDLLNDQIQTWSHLLPSESPASISNSPLVWDQEKSDVPLLKPAIPKSFNSSFVNANLILSSVEENLREDALDDWEPFSKDSAVSPTSAVTGAFANAESIARSITIVRSPVRGRSDNYKVMLSPCPYDLEEGTRLSTPLDWKPLHPLDPSSPFHESGLKHSSEALEKSFHSFTLSDDHLISQGDAARARRKRRQKQPVLEIPAELIARRDTVQIVNLLKKRGVRFLQEPEGPVPELPPLPPAPSKI